MEKREIHGIDVFIEGQGEETIVMIHGWPDTYRLWDQQVEVLKSKFRCVRFTLPGFDINKPRKLYTLQDEVDIFSEIIDTVSPDKKVILMLHDWGCFFGYQYYMLNQNRVSKVIGIDVGDVGSKDMKLPLSMVLFAAGYQLWLALAWKIGGKTGDAMTRKMAKSFKVRADLNLIHSGMNYAYHLRWKHFFLRKPQGNIIIDPACPMLFFFGRNKPTMFHSEAFVDRLNRAEGSRAIGMDTGHWIMLDNPEGVNSEILNWLEGR
jgi:pimeloyl-ACP methyl ester carboxylesterase